MKVFYDTNVILDVLLNRVEFLSDSMAALKLSELGIVKGYISVVSITDIFYLVKKNLKDRTLALKKMEILFNVVHIAKADEKVAVQALNSHWKNFEDAVQYSVARRLRAKYIVTRNKEDFENSEITVVTPTEFVKLMRI